MLKKVSKFKEFEREFDFLYLFEIYLFLVYISYCLLELSIDAYRKSIFLFMNILH